MNALEELLQEQLNHLIDRIASGARQGTTADCLERRPDLAARLSEAEDELCSARQRVLRDYGSWCRALADCGDVWTQIQLEAAPATSSEQRVATETVEDLAVLATVAPGFVDPVKPALGVEHRAVKTVAVPRYLSPTAA